MNDDRGTGKFAHDFFREWWLNNSEVGIARYSIAFHAFISGFIAGCKAERERCLGIARGFSSCEGIAQKIAKEIEEAQDGK